MKKIYANELSVITLSLLMGFAHASSPFTPVPSDIIAKQKIKKAKDNLLIILDDTSNMGVIVDYQTKATRFTLAQRGLQEVLNAGIYSTYPKIYSDFNIGLSTFSRTSNGNASTSVLAITELDRYLVGTPSNIDEYNSEMLKLGKQYVMNGKGTGGLSARFIPFSQWTLQRSARNNLYDNLDAYFYPKMAASAMKYRCANNHVIVVTNKIPADFAKASNPTNTRYMTPKKAAETSRWSSVHTGSLWDASLNPGHNKDDQDTPSGKFNENGWPEQIIHTHFLLMHDGALDGTRGWGEQSAKEAKGYFEFVSGTQWQDISKAFIKLLQELKRDPLPTLAVNPGFSHVATNDLNTLSFQVYANNDIWASQVRAVAVKKNGADGREDEHNGRMNAYHQAYSWSTDPKKSYSIVINTPTHGIQSLNYGDLSKNLSNASFDLPSSSNNSEWENKFVPWLAFWQNTTYSDPKTGYRIRGSNAYDYDRFIGDMLSGNILFSGPVNDFTYKLMLDGGNDTTTKLNEFMFLNSNDGMTKIYQNQNNTGNNPYNFIFGYIPGAAKRENGRSLIQDIKERANPDYTKDDMHPHIYLSNGDTRQMTSPRGHNIIVTTIGQAGKGAFALNIGGNTDWNKTEKVGVNAAKDNTRLKDTVPLWDTAAKIQGGAGVGVSGTENMGYTVGAPAIDIVALRRTEDKHPIISGKDADVRMAAFIANGAESSENTPTLYIIDTIGAKMHKSGSVDNGSKGKLIAKLSTDSVLGNKNSALSTPVPVDLDGDDIADLVYAGDRNGDLYRFDLRGTSPEKWTAQLLFKGSLEQPISSAPSVHVQTKGKKLMIVFGTGSDLYTKDSQDTTEQALYGIIDDVSKDITTPITQDDLLEQKLSKTGGVKYRTVSSNEITDKQKGWFIPLNQKGEKIIKDVEVRNGTVYANTVIFRPKKPNDIVAETKCDASTANADSWLLMVKAENGSLADKLVSGMKNKNGEYIAGLYFEGSMLNSPNFLSPSLNLVTGQGFAHNENGIRTKTGQSQFGQDKVEQEKGCVKGKTYIYIPDPDNPSKRLAKQIICAASKGLTRRISWRIL